MNMDKRDFKKLTELQLIKLLLKQGKNGQANEFENSIVSLPNSTVQYCSSKRRTMSSRSQVGPLPDQLSELSS